MSAVMYIHRFGTTLTSSPPICCAAELQCGEPFVISRIVSFDRLVLKTRVQDAYHYTIRAGVPPVITLVSQVVPFASLNGSCIIINVLEGCQCWLKILYKG